MQLPLHVKKINYSENNSDKNKKKTAYRSNVNKKEEEKSSSLFIY